MFDSADIPLPDRPEEALAAVVALRRLATTLERSAVDHALAQGWTWSRIGQALGMTAQAAHKRLSPTRRTTRDQKGTGSRPPPARPRARQVGDPGPGESRSADRGLDRLDHRG